MITININNIQTLILQSGAGCSPSVTRPKRGETLRLGSVSAAIGHPRGLSRLCNCRVCGGRGIVEVNRTGEVGGQEREPCPECGGTGRPR